MEEGKAVASLRVRRLRPMPVFYQPTEQEIEEDWQQRKLRDFHRAVHAVATARQIDLLVNLRPDLMRGFSRQAVPFCDFPVHSKNLQLFGEHDGNG